MQRWLVYPILAIVFGVSIVLVPFLSYSALNPQRQAIFLEGTRMHTTDVGSFNPVQQSSFNSEIEALAISFVIAFMAYALFRRRILRDDYRRVWVNRY
jgi:hypothetical protein